MAFISDNLSLGSLLVDFKNCTTRLWLWKLIIAALYRSSIAMCPATRCNRRDKYSTHPHPRGLAHVTKLPILPNMFTVINLALIYHNRYRLISLYSHLCLYFPPLDSLKNMWMRERLLQKSKTNHAHATTTSLYLKQQPSKQLLSR